MILGSVVTWFKQGRYRKIARQRGLEAESLRQAASQRAAGSAARPCAAAPALTYLPAHRILTAENSMLHIFGRRHRPRADLSRAGRDACGPPSARARCSRCVTTTRSNAPEGADFDPAADAGLDRLQGGGRIGRGPYRRQDRHRLARQQRHRQAGRDRALPAARRRHRRAAGADRRAAPDAMAHRLRIGARRLLPGARGRLEAAGDRRRRAVASSSPAPMPRCGRSRKSASGTARPPMPRRSPPRCARKASRPRPSPTSTPNSAGPTSSRRRRFRPRRWSRARMLKPGTHVDLVGGFTPGHARGR